MERMMLAIEDSLKISRRFQFFLWAQGALQGVVPHDAMICVFGDFSGLRFKYDIFSRTPVPPELVQAFTDPVEGLLKRLISHWLGNQRNPCLFGGLEGEAADLGDEMRELGCGHVLAHGAREITGGEGSFFVFLKTSPKAAQQHLHLMDMLMPHLHMALYRMVPNETCVETIELAPESILSSREIEVLRWVRDGMTNQEIGHQLNISPLTVKNHVQNILRKLRVSNRAQAVAKSANAAFFAVEGQA